MDIISLIIQVISGAVGGNIAGAAMKENSLGTLGIPSPELSVAAWVARSSRRYSEPPQPAAAVSTCRAS
jgi:hypothetical protein